MDIYHVWCSEREDIRQVVDMRDLSSIHTRVMAMASPAGGMDQPG